MRKKWFQTGKCDHSGATLSTIRIESMIGLFLIFRIITTLSLLLLAWNKRSMIKNYFHTLKTRTYMVSQEKPPFTSTLINLLHNYRILSRLTLLHYLFHRLNMMLCILHQKMLSKFPELDIQCWTMLILLLVFEKYLICSPFQLTRTISQVVNHFWVGTACIVDIIISYKYPEKSSNLYRIAVEILRH